VSSPLSPELLDVAMYLDVLEQREQARDSHVAERDEDSRRGAGWE
jgi:hypothetical protein